MGEAEKRLHSQDKSGGKSLHSGQQLFILYTILVVGSILCNCIVSIVYECVSLCLLYRHKAEQEVRDVWQTAACSLVAGT